jgi:hypothetical protein
MSVSASTRRALQKVTDNQGVLAMLEISHPSFDVSLRIINDTRDHTIFGELWQGLPFAVTLPNDKAKETPRAKLQMDNVGREITADLESLPPGASLKATMTIVHRSTPETIDYQFRAPLSGVRVMGPTITATMGRDDIMRMSAVHLRFDPATSPSLFGE